MRKLNVKFLFFLLLGLIVLTGTLFAVRQLQAANIARGLLWQANQAEQEGRLQQSSRYLVRYLEFAPEDLEQRARLGKMLSDPKLAVTPRARRRARFIIDQVLIKDPNRADLRKCLVRLALEENDLSAADVQLRLLKKLAPEDGEAAALRGQLHERWVPTPGKDAHVPFQDFALSDYWEAVKFAPNAAEGYVRLINHLRKRDQGQMWRYGREAAQWAAQALQRLPTDVGVLLAAAEVAQDLTQWDKASAHLQKALSLEGRTGRVHLAVAQLEIRQGHQTKAIDRLRLAFKIVPQQDRFELSWTLANLLLDTGEVEEALLYIPKTKTPGIPDAGIDFLRARVLMSRSRWYDASAQLERVRHGFKAVPELMAQTDLYLGQCYGQLREPSRQLVAYERVLKVQPNNVLARQGMAAALMALGRTDVAILEHQKVVQLGEYLQKPTGGHLELVRALLVNNLQTDKADWPAVEEALTAAEKEEPDSLDVVLLRAEMYLAQKNPEKVPALLTAALNKQPGKIELWNALAVYYQRQGRPQDAYKVFDDAGKKLGDSVGLRLARARLIAALEKPDAAKTALTQLEAGWQKLPANQQALLLGGLAEAYVSIDLLRDATRLMQLVAQNPRYLKDVRVRLVLFDLGLRLGDDTLMQQALAEVKILEEGESPFYLYGQAARRIYLARQGQTALVKEARQLLDRVVQLRPAWPAVLLAKAEVEEMQGNPEQAIVNYHRAIEQGERSPRVLRQLVQLLTQRQRFDEAEKVLKQMQQQSQLSPEDEKLLLAMRIDNNDFDKAVWLMRQKTSANSKDYKDQLWMGQVLSASGHTSQEAEQALRKAVALAETEPDTWVALLQYLVRTNQHSLALKELEKAKGKLPQPKSALALGMCCELLGDLKQAQQFFQAALKHQPEEILVYRSVAGFYLRTGNPQEAEKHIRAVLDRKAGAAEADLAWARRSLALTLAGSGDPKRLPEAFALVGIHLDNQGGFKEDKFADSDSLEDLLARARILATQNRQRYRARAIVLLEDVKKRQALPPDEQLLLAHLYMGQGPNDVARGKARMLLLELVANHRGNPNYLALAAEALIKNGDARDALNAISRLEQVEQVRKAVADGSPALELKARALEALGKADEALTLLRSYAAAKNAPPERWLLVAGQCGRLGQVKEAIDLCLQEAKQCRVEAVGGAAVVVLREGRPLANLPLKPSQDALDSHRKKTDAWKVEAGRTEAWFQQTLKKQPTNLMLLLQLADLQKMLERPREAEQLYRQVLSQQPQQAVALNNLAWLLAEQTGKQEEALTLINRAIEQFGPRPEFLDTRGVVQLNLGRYDTAVADLKQAIEDAPSFTKNLHLAQAQQKLGNRAAAQKALDLARRLSPPRNRLGPGEQALLKRLETELQN